MEEVLEEILKSNN